MTAQDSPDTVMWAAQSTSSANADLRGWLARSSSSIGTVTTLTLDQTVGKATTSYTASVAYATRFVQLTPMVERGKTTVSDRGV